MKRGFFAILIGATVVAVLLMASKWRSEPKTVSGFIEAHEIRLGSRVGGRVAKVLVQEGDTVTAGQVLVELEPFDLQAREAEARANLADAIRLHVEDRIAHGEQIKVSESINLTTVEVAV